VHNGGFIPGKQWRAWNHLGLFDAKLNEAALPRHARLVNVMTTSAPLELRARSYLDANCAPCHRPGGAGAFFDARFDTPLKFQNLINGPVANQLGVIGAKVIVPGDMKKSILFHRVSIMGENQMPPLARNVVDEPAVAVLAQWIDSLPERAPTLPKGWSKTDIGSASTPGQAGYLNGSYNLIAANDDIWENADSVLFACRSLTGDGEIIAHVAAMQYTDPWAKAGVMIREDFSPGAKYALMAVTGSGGATFQWRADADQPAYNTDGPPMDQPRWVKLVRTGKTLNGYISLDGKVWRQVGSVAVPMNKTISVGLGLAGHNSAMSNSTLFDSVSVGM
jgi:mono/diheme cytochrome c family protein